MPPETAQIAFRRAKSLLQATGSGLAVDRFEKDDSINAVQQAMKAAQIHYQSHPHSKARKWLTRLSSHIMHYSSVLDVFAQYHPEYTALAWGTFKLLFIGVINHETSLKELSKALFRIACVLPSVEMNLFLYSSPAMIELAASLYAKIMEFSCRAIKWYNSGKLKHIIGAITRPFALSFKDLVVDIKEIVQDVKDLAVDLRGQEIRRITHRQEEMHQEQANMLQKLSTLEQASKDGRDLMEDVKKMMMDFHQIQYIGLLDTSKRVCEVQISQLMSFASSTVLTDPTTCRQIYACQRKQRRRLGQSDLSVLSDSKQLQQWSASSRHSQLVVYGSFESRKTLKDFAIDAIDVVETAGVPVIWALKVEETNSKTISSIDVLKYLISQVLQQNKTLHSERAASLNVLRFQSANTEQEWYGLLASTLNGLPQVYIFIDIGVLDDDLDPAKPWAEAFSQLFDMLTQRNVQTTVKIAFLGNKKSHKAQLGDIKRESFIDISKVHSARVQKSRLSHSRYFGRKGHLRRLDASVRAPNVA